MQRITFRLMLSSCVSICVCECVCVCALRSALRDTLAIPQTKTKFGERSFAVTGPTIWNSLPDSVKAAETVGIFKSKLKTHLFGLSYDLPL